MVGLLNPRISPSHGTEETPVMWNCWQTQFMSLKIKILCDLEHQRGCSSYGRALASHARGTGFDSPHLQAFVFFSSAWHQLLRSMFRDRLPGKKTYSSRAQVRLFRAASSPPARKKENPASETLPRNPWIPSWRRRSANSRGSTSRARGATSTPAPPCSPSSRYISAIRLDLLPFFLTWGVS